MSAQGPDPPKRGNCSREYTVLLVLVLLACVAAVCYMPTPQLPEDAPLGDRLLAAAVGLLQCFGLFVGLALLLAAVEFIKQAIARYRGQGRDGAE